MGVCDTCGAPATMLASDVRRTGLINEQWITFESYGPLKRGCALHPVQSVEHDESGTVLGFITDPQGRYIPRGEVGRD